MAVQRGLDLNREQQFSTLLHRFMLLGLIAFLALVLITAVSYLLDSATEPSALTLNDLRSELASIREADGPDDDAKLRAESQYNLALTQIDERDFTEAINALRRSIEAVPTLTAQETLSYLYRQQGDAANEADAMSPRSRFHSDSIVAPLTVDVSDRGTASS